MRRSKLLKKGIYIVNALTIIDFILLSVFSNKIYYSIYWVLIPLLFVLLVLFNRETDKGKVNADKYSSKRIQWIYNNLTTIAIILYGLTYLAIEFINVLDGTMKYNIYAIYIMLILTIAYEIILAIIMKNFQMITSVKLNKKKK
jgi:hypothetical protein